MCRSVMCITMQPCSMACSTQVKDNANVHCKANILALLTMSTSLRACVCLVSMRVCPAETPTGSLYQLVSCFWCTESAPGQLGEWDPAMGNFRAAPTQSTLWPSPGSGPVQGTPVLAHHRSSATGGQIRPPPLYHDPYGARHLALPPIMAPTPQSSLAAVVSQSNWSKPA